MSLSELVLLAFLLSIDALSVGFALGQKGICFPRKSKLVFCIAAWTLLFFAHFGGRKILTALPISLSLTSSLLPLGLGLFFLLSPLFPQKEKPLLPSHCDRDGSRDIDQKEACLLALLLDLDGCGVAPVMEDGWIMVSFCVCFQVMLLSFGSFLAKKRHLLFAFPEEMWSVLTGALLIILAVRGLF